MEHDSRVITIWEDKQCLRLGWLCINYVTIRIFQSGTQFQKLDLPLNCQTFPLTPLKILSLSATDENQFALKHSSFKQSFNYVWDHKLFSCSHFSSCSQPLKSAPKMKNGISSQRTWTIKSNSPLKKIYRTPLLRWKVPHNEIARATITHKIIWDRM